MKNTAIALSLLIGLSAVTTSAAEDVMIVYDGSNSMWGQIDGIAKIETAREVMADLIETWPQSTNLGLTAYGHRREGDCGDIELMIPPGPVDVNSFLATVNGITPRGKTPLTDAVVEAAETLSFRDNPATVVLISDGIESCQADPCSIAAELEQQGIAFTTHVIGFDVAREDQRQLSCIAENTGGTFVPAQDADELRNAMTQVQAVIQTAPEPEPQPEPEPEPEPEAPEQTVSAPATVTFGTEFTVTWGETINPRDWITIVPVGADEGDYLAFQRVQGDDSVEIRAPADPGLYEVRYVLDEGSKTLASTPVEVIEAEQTVSAPASVTFGTEFTVTWGETVNPRDWITIVPVGADEGDYLAFQRVQGDDSVEIRAPADPGLYEVRYVLDEGSKTLASTPVEVVEAEQTVSAPASVTFGTEFTVTWSETVNPRDWITIVPVDAEEGDYLAFQRVQGNDSVEIRAPADPGLYEVRYVLDEGSKTLASTPVEVVEAEQSVSAPGIVRAESTFEVSWSETVNPRDWVTIVPVGADEGDYLAFQRVQGNDSVELQAPADPGLYEVRYVLDEGSKTLASSPVEVVAADAPLDDGAGLSVPASAAPGETISVSWTIAPEDADRRVTLAASDAPDFTWISAHPVGPETETDITLPAEPGQYEVRFLDLGRQEVLGRAIIAVGD
ncbi:MAG: VWA domain-containing protein [Devosia sp.]